MKTMVTGSKIWILGVALVFFCTFTVFAGRGDKSGTAAAPELLIPVGARTIALSGASLSTVSGLESIFWNPAGLSRMQHPFSIMFSHTTYLSDIGVDYVAIGGEAFGSAAVALTLKSLSFGQIPITTEDHPDGTGETASPTFMIIGGTFSRQISDRISTGITVNYVYEKMLKVSASTFAFNAGVQYVGLGGIEGLSVGVCLKNIGPALKYDGEGLERLVDVTDASRPPSILKLDATADDLPSTIEIGLGYSTTLTPQGQINISSTFQNNNFSEDEYKLGMEYIYDNRIFLRSGYAFASEADGQEYIFGFSAGAGVRSTVQGIEVIVNYGYRSVQFFAGSHVIDVTLGF